MVAKVLEHAADRRGCVRWLTGSAAGELEHGLEEPLHRPRVLECGFAAGFARERPFGDLKPRPQLVCKHRDEGLRLGIRGSQFGKLVDQEILFAKRKAH